jgi:ABC-type dipeptide/oligopeptide/nickel transport system permease subunit
MAQPSSSSDSAWPKLARNRLFLCGAFVVLAFSLLALSAPALTQAGLLRNPLEQFEQGLDEDAMPLGPSRQFVAGTDDLGRDLLARVIHGARISLGVGIAAMLTATIIGTLVGLLAGFYGGKVDLALMRITEVNLTIPALLLAIAFAGLMKDGRVLHLHPANVDWHSLDIVLRPGAGSVFILIGLVSWPGMVRVIRAQTLAVKEREFIAASRVLGASNSRLILRHMLPNILPTIIVIAMMTTANTIVLEAGLGYLGVGVPPPAPTWGAMIGDAQTYFAAAPHMVVVPGLALVLTVVGFNLLGQGLQEVLNPFAKGRK